MKAHLISKEKIGLLKTTRVTWDVCRVRYVAGSISTGRWGKHFILPWGCFHLFKCNWKFNYIECNHVWGDCVLSEVIKDTHVVGDGCF